jgi:hypothetical protein
MQTRIVNPQSPSSGDFRVIGVLHLLGEQLVRMSGCSAPARIY